MIICVDARSLVEKKVGFGYFLQNMLESLLEIDTHNQYILLSDRTVYFNFSKYQNVEIINYHDTPLFPRSFFYYHKLAKWLKCHGIEPDVFWGTQHILPKDLPSKTKKVLTIHDFTHILFPNTTTKFNLLITKLFFANSIKFADSVVCISKSTENGLRKLFAKESLNKRVITIYEGGCKNQAQVNEEELSEIVRSCISNPYILFVGTIEPRKNIKILIDLAMELNGVAQVIICGKIGWEKKEIINQLTTTDNLLYLNYINESEKLYLMRHCCCQIQPSIYEGFGLPVVESMQCGTIVVVANNSSLSEIVEIDELKYSTFDVKDLKDKVLKVMTDATLKEKALLYCKKRAKDFAWETAAFQYLNEFERKQI